MRWSDGALKPCFLLMPEGQNHHLVVGLIINVKSGVAGISKGNEQFPEFGIVGERPAHFRR